MTLCSYSCLLLVILTGLADGATPALRHMNSDVSEDDVFMARFHYANFYRNNLLYNIQVRIRITVFFFLLNNNNQTLDLPMERSELQQSSPTPTTTSTTAVVVPVTTTNATPPPLPKEPHLHRIHFMQRRPLPPSSSTSSLPLLNNSIDGSTGTTDPFSRAMDSYSSSM